MKAEKRKISLCKELNAETQGRVKELDELLNLFSPAKSSSEPTI